MDRFARDLSGAGELPAAPGTAQVPLGAVLHDAIDEALHEAARPSLAVAIEQRAALQAQNRNRTPVGCAFPAHAGELAESPDNSGVKELILRKLRVARLASSQDIERAADAAPRRVDATNRIPKRSRNATMRSVAAGHPRRNRFSLAVGLTEARGTKASPCVFRR